MLPKEDDSVDLENVSNSEAHKILDTLCEVGTISDALRDNAKGQYERLHSALLAAMARERQLLDEAKGLKRSLEEEEARAEEAERRASQFEGVSTEVLREDVEAALSEAQLAAERQQLLQVEVGELVRQRDELVTQLDTIQQQHANALQPVLQGLQEEVSTLKAEVAVQTSKREGTSREAEEVRSRLTQVQDTLDKLQADHRIETNALLKVASAPEKARRQADLMVPELTNARAAVEAAESRLIEGEAALARVLEKQKEKQAEHQQLLSSLERGRIMIEARERHCADVDRDVELAHIEADREIAEQLDLDMALKGLVSEVKAASEALARARHEKEMALRQYKAADEAIKAERETLPPLRIARDLIIKDRAEAEVAVQRVCEEIEVLKQDVDVRVAAFLKEESFGKDKATLFGLIRKEVKLLEEELDALKLEARERGRLVSELAAQRDRASRLVASKLAKLRATQNEARLRTSELRDLKQVRKDVLRRCSDFAALYDLVKNQRNKFVSLLGAAGQASDEMGERLRLLSHEKDILQGETAGKQKLLGKAKQQRVGAVKERDGLRKQLCELGHDFKTKHEALEEQVNDIEKLSRTIGHAEGDMLRMRRQYEAVIQARNSTGIMLIDRNDELCVLYEKAHMQEAVIAQGTVELQKRENEIRVLQIEVAELQRSIGAIQRAMPDTDHVDKDVARLRAQLFEARREAEQLALVVEDPSNPARFRVLEGKIPDKEELIAKIQSLDERLNERKEALLEKEVVLAEVDALAKRLRGQASQGRSDMLDVASKANKYQQKLRSVTHRIMAAISELSLYQAMALKLQAERDDMQKVVQEARARLESGHAPTDDCDSELERQQREQATVADLQRQRAEIQAVLDRRGAGPVPTAAEPRPNAYIPEELGIPKPYGGFGPFKPTALGSTMRHIRKPAPREIII